MYVVLTDTQVFKKYHETHAGGHGVEWNGSAVQLLRRELALLALFTAVKTKLINL